MQLTVNSGPKGVYCPFLLTDCAATARNEICIGNVFFISISIENA